MRICETKLSTFPNRKARALQNGAPGYDAIRSGKLRFCMTSATQSSGVLALALRWNYFFSAALAVGVYFRLWLLPTAPWRSNSGNLFAGLIANILCGGVADQSNIEGVLPRLRAIFERLGCMESSSDDLFGQFHHPGGSHPQLRDDGANHRVPWVTPGAQLHKAFAAPGKAVINEKRSASGRTKPCLWHFASPPPRRPVWIALFLS